MSEKVGKAHVINETAKALLVKLEDEKTPRWIPKSAIDEDSEVWKTGQDGELVVADWFAEKEGLD